MRAGLEIFRTDPRVLVFVFGPNRRARSRFRVCSVCECSCDHHHRVCFLHVFVHTWKKGRGVCWMSHIVPPRPGDIAGGQSGMEPERGDSDK